MRFEKDIKYALLALFIGTFEAVFGKYIKIFGAVPMLTFSFCIVSALVEYEESYVMVLSALLGAVSDILYGHGFGTYTVAFSFSAVATFRLKDAIFSSKWLFLVLDAFLMTFLVQVFYMILHIGDIGTNNFFKGLWSIVLPMAFYNTAVCCLFYYIANAFSRKRR
ncbi:MAG: rod shape-determining protein MreD [Clostridia bacterium]|nr:rod shape-determining protein MreD [Clostridia bacterium]